MSANIGKEEQYNKNQVEDYRKLLKGRDNPFLNISWKNLYISRTGFN